MSYDIELLATRCPTCGQLGPEPYGADPTYNLTPLFDLALTGEELPSQDTSEYEAVALRKNTDRPRGLRLLDGRKAVDTIHVLRAGLDRIRDLELRPRFVELAVANKGWGTYEDAVEVLSYLLECAEAYPENTWRVR